MTIDLVDLRRARPECVRRLARFLGIRTEGRDHRQLCSAVFLRINRGRP